MESTEITRKAEDFALAKMKNYDPGHDWWHVTRVRRLATYINSIERSADFMILDIAAILHDVADSKFASLPDPYQEIEALLSVLVNTSEKFQIMNAIRNMSFSNKNPMGELKDPVFMILQDADRLDAMGAIGIARAFSYGGYKGNMLFEPSEGTGGKQGTTIHHFYDKLLKLKELMNTATARDLAEVRHEFLQIFLDQFYEEWDRPAEIKKEG